MSRGGANSQDAIQILLSVEKRANEKVTEARKRKTRLLKQAKAEAQQVIEKERCQLELEAKEREKEILGNKSYLENEIKNRLVDQEKEIEFQISQNSEKTIQLLLNAVLDVKPNLHRNFVLMHPPKTK